MVLIPTFLRQTPPTQLRELFVWSGWTTEQASALGDLADGTEHSAAARKLFEEGTTLATDKFVAATDQIEQLRSDQGQRALYSVAQAIGIGRKILEALEDPRACAIHLLVRDEKAFDRALASHYADRFGHGRMWSGFALSGGKTVALNATDGAKSRFEAALIDCLGKDQQSGRCRVDWFERVVEDADGGAPARVVQATLYQEARPQVEPRFSDDGEITSQMRRPVHEGAVMFDEHAGQLDIVAKGGKITRAAIAEAFSEHLLVGADDAQLIEMRPLDLSGLSSPCVFALRAEDGVETVEIERLRLAGPHSDGFMVTLETGGGLTDDRSIHEQALRFLGPGAPVGRPGWKVIFAGLRVTFAPEAGAKRRKSVRVELALPNRTNLRDQTERHRLIGGKLLERWGLYRVENAG